MTTYPQTGFPQQLADLFKRVTKLETRTRNVDSGTLVQTVTGVIDPAYASGQPNVLITGAAALSGPYQCVSSYNPGAGDSVILIPSGATYIVAGLSPSAVGAAQFVVAGADVPITNSTTQTAVPGMSFQAVAGASVRYLIEAYFAYDGPTAANIAFTWAVPAGAVMNRCITAPQAAATDNANTTVTMIRRSAGTAQVAGTTAGVSNGFTVWQETSMLLMSATAGAVQLQFAQGTANASPTTFRSFSWFCVTRVA